MSEQIIQIKTPEYITLLTHLEHRKLTGSPARRPTRSEEKAWSIALCSRIQAPKEALSQHGSYTISNFIAFLQFDESQVKHFTPDHEEYIAMLIKDHLLTYEEIQKYNAHCEANFRK